MKKNTFIILAACVAATVSCTKVHKIAEEPDAAKEIVFSAGGGLLANVETKATAAVTSLSSFNVNCITGTAGSSESSVFNVSFSGSSSYTGGQYWPSTDKSYKFYASNATITPGASGPYVNASGTQDVVCAVLTAPEYKKSNKLDFQHIFARIGKCKISAPSGYTVSDLSVKITPKISGVYNLFAGNGHTDGTGWTSTSASSPVTIATSLGSETDNGLYIVPGVYKVTASYTLSVGAYSETFSKSSDISVVGGKINNISSSLPSGNATQITFSVNVSEWTDNDIAVTLS